ncbi:ABC transporter permease [Microbacterium sp. AK031]|uniref:ABC transporter permease n=1 Tax=Microbacterium sp. AK031 TaxID=2723076 RepID=UPI002166C5EE|nr:ABC transporter permease [Microbacterium sp. AK031]MCS3843253.1 ABC-2 type transport system permease protein [Microbacterium sp. AK031]
MTVSTGTSLSPVQGVWLVAERELSTKLRSKAYLISTGILLLMALAGVIWAGIASATPSTTQIAATSTAASVLQGAEGYEITDVADRAEAEKLVADGTVEAAVIDDDSSPTGTVIIADKEAPQSLLLMLSESPTVELLNPDAAGGGLRYILGIAFGLVFMMAAITFGSPIATSVVEEKQTRVIEILLSAIPARILLAGKVLGNTLLAISQILLLVVVGAIGLMVSGQTAVLQGIGGPIAWFAVFFFFGFILLAAMFAAAGSLVSRQEDVGATMTPVMYLTMIPYFLVIFFGDNPVVMTVLSYVPFSAPVGMPIRLFFNEAAWWEPLASLAIMLVACVIVVLIGAKIYENSLLKMGARVKLREALRG